MAQVTTVANRKPLTAESITKKTGKAVEKGLLTYWRAGEPSKQSQLSTAVSTAKKDHQGRSANDRWVFFPDLRMVGAVSEILARLHEAQQSQVTVGQLHTITGGQLGNAPGNYALSADVIRGNSLDPLNPQHAGIIEQFVAQVKAQSHGGKKEKAPKSHYDFAGKTSLLAQAKDALKGSAAASTTAPKGAKAGGRGADANKQARIVQFESAMDTVAAGQLLQKVLDVGKFDAGKFTGVHPKNPPGERATAFRPVVNVGGRALQLPIIAQSAGFQNMKNYINSVVASSKYAQYAPLMLQAVESRSAGQTLAAAPVLAPLSVVAAPTLAQPMTLSMPVLGGQPLARSPVSAVSPGPRAGQLSPRLGTLPQLGALPTLGGMGTLQLPTLL